MYEVTSATKPARRWLGLVATGALLLTATGVGWWAVHTRQVGATVELGEPTYLDDIGIRLRLPQGWKRNDQQFGELMAVTLSDPNPEDARELYVATWPASYAHGRILCLYLDMRMKSIGLGVHRRTEGGERARFGPLGAWHVHGAWLGLDHHGEVDTTIAWSPEGRAYFVSLRSIRRFRRSDRELISAVTESIEIPDLDLAKSLEGLNGSAGIHMEVPKGALVYEPNQPDVAMLSLLAGPDSDRDWRIEIFRTWPRPEGGVEALVAAHRTEVLHDMVPLKRIEQASAGVNQAWRTQSLTPKEWELEFQTCTEVWGVQHREGLAAMVVAETAGDEQKAIREVCHKIARSIRLEPTPLAPAEGPAVALAEEIVREIETRSVRQWWSVADEETWYKIDLRGDQGMHWEHRRLVDSGEGAEKRFEAGTLTLVRYDVGDAYSNYEDYTKWQTDLRAKGFRFEQFIPAMRREDKTIHIIDNRLAGTDALEHFIKVGSRRYYGTLATPPDFVPDPVLNIAYGMVAQQPEGKAALFSGIGSSERSLNRRMCRSLGAFPEQRGANGKPLRGVSIQRDFDATTSRYFFDEEGRLIRVERGPNHTVVRSTRSEVEDALGAEVVAEWIGRWNRAPWLPKETATAPSTTRTAPN